MKIFILFFFMYMITATHYVVAQDSLYVCQYGASINQGATSDIDSIIFSKEFGGLQDTMYVFRSGKMAKKRALSDIDSIIFHSLGSVAIPGDSVTDIDGNFYGTLQLGPQIWMTGNLKVTHYINGDEIPLAVSNDEWENPSPAYCWYDHEETNKAVYGALYNWHAVETDSICPVGWHVATDEDWTQLVNYLGAIGHEGYEADVLKSDIYFDDRNKGSDIYGFSAVAGGYRTEFGGFTRQSIEGYWWTGTSYSQTHAWQRKMGSRYETLNTVSRSVGIKGRGFSVQCVKDE